MSIRFQVVCLLTIVLTSGQCFSQEQHGGVSLVRAGDVMELTDSNFVSRLAEIDLALVKFYAPSCEICRKMAPEFEKAASLLVDNSPPITLADIDCTGEGKRTCADNGVSQYPTLRAFTRGEVAFDYDGPTQSDALVAFMKAKAGPSSKELQTMEDAERFFANTEVFIVGFFDNEASEAVKEFQKLSDMFGNRIRFGHTLNADVGAKYSHKNEIVLYREPRFHTKMEPAEISFKGGDFTLSNLKEWVLKNMHSLVGHRTLRNMDEFRQPLIVVYFDVNYRTNAKGSTYWRNRIVKVAKKFAEAERNVSFAISNAKEFKMELGSFGLKLDKLPAVAARNLDNQKFRMTEEFSVENLEQFVNSFLEGKIKPYLKTEPVPETNDGPVKIVVAETFGEIVNDVTKDVLIEIYSPMCGHCMVLAPKYEKLAVKLKEEDSLLIAKIDGTANEIPEIFDIQGFPTIYLVPKGSKDKPIIYSGEHEVDGLLVFLAREATDPLKGFDRKGRPVKSGKKKTSTDREL